MMMNLNYNVTRRHLTYMEEKNSEKKERKMRDSGIPWIGEVPEKWKVMKIGHCFRLKNEKKFFTRKQGAVIISLYRNWCVSYKQRKSKNKRKSCADSKWI